MLRNLTLTQALAAIKTGEINTAEITGDVLSSIEAQNPTLNVFLHVNRDAALQSEKMTSQPLAGLPIAFKDNICTKGLPTTAASTLLEKFIPPYDATVSRRLKTAGATIIGKTNLDAWAHGSSTETSQFGTTLNPRNPQHLPGGSSGGSAAAVAGNMCIASMGTETAGSIRQPAAWCGVVGLKPTYGRVSRSGLVAMASSTDSPGPITKTVADAALMLNYLAGHDPLDGTSSTQDVPDYTASLGCEIKGMKIGVLYLEMSELAHLKRFYEPVLKILADLGAEVEFTQALDPHYAISVYTVIQRAEVSSNLGRYDGIRYGQDRTYFGAEAKRRVMLGTYTLSKGYADQYYHQAQKVRTLFLDDYDRLFQKYDVLISPTSPGFAKKIGASEGSAMFGELEDMLLEPSSITGLPGISVPCYRDPDTNLFLGLNIMAPMWREDRVLQVGDAFEQATLWNSWRQHD